MKYKLNSVVFYLYKMKILQCRIIKITNIESINELESRKIYTLNIITNIPDLTIIDVLESEIFTSVSTLKNNIKLI